MSKPCPLSEAEIENAERNALPEWLPPLRDFANASTNCRHWISLVDARKDRWTCEAKPFAQAFAKLARRRRVEVGLIGESFKPIIWKDQVQKIFRGIQVRGWCVLASPTDVHRFEDSDGFTPLNLVETCRLLNLWRPNERVGDALKEECRQLVRHLYRGSERPGRAVGSPFAICDIVNANAAGLRDAGAVAEVRWGECWGKWPASSRWLDEVEMEMEEKFRDSFVEQLRDLSINDLYWVTRNGRRLPKKEGLVLVMEGLGGRRNFGYGLNLYTTSVAVAWATTEGRGRWFFEPICSGVYTVAEGLLYLGVAGPTGGAVVMDERVRYHPVRPLLGSPTDEGGDLAVGLHHSRSQKRRGRAFVGKVSRVLPAYVNKVVAPAAGAYSLSLTAAGNLGAYFESSVNLISAYAGAVLLVAATGRPAAATDLKGASWVEGNPLTKTGLLAWGHEGLRAHIGAKLP